MRARASPAGLLACLLSSLAPQGSSEDAADKEFAKVVELFGKGLYAKAQKGYERLAAEYPHSRAGRVAAERSKPSAFLGERDLLRHGPSANRVDVVVMGDGFTIDKLNPFDDFAKNLPAMFDHDRVFGEYFSYLNFIAAEVVSEEEGVDGYGRQAKTALGSFVQQGTNVDHTWVDVELVHGVLKEMTETDGYALVFVPLGTVGSGGDGVGVLSTRDPRDMLHEWGHAFAELKDEYSDDTSYRGPVQSWINVSDTEDKKLVPWKHFIEAKVPGVGAYEGADGRNRGAWKPTASGCLMEQGETLCPVCREAVVLQIYQHVDPIESARVTSAPDVHVEGELTGAGPHKFEVRTLRPKSHAIEVEWFVFPEAEAPKPAGDPALRPRAQRGPLAPIAAKSTHRSRAKDGEHEFVLDLKDLVPGRYRVVCRVKDTTESRGDRFPWVLEDVGGLLESERGWWVRVQ